MTNDIEHARAVRAQRAAILRGLGDGGLSLPTVLRNPPDAVKACPVYDLVKATHNMGPIGAKRALREARVYPLKLVRNLRTSEVEALIQKLPKRAK